MAGAEPEIGDGGKENNKQIHYMTLIKMMSQENDTDRMSRTEVMDIFITFRFSVHDTAAITIWNQRLCDTLRNLLLRRQRRPLRGAGRAPAALNS